MKVAQTSTRSTDAPRLSGDNDPAIPRVPGPRKPSGLGPRPAPPARPLTARPLSHDLDWDSIPTAPHGPVSMTRQQVRAQLAAVEAEGSHERTERTYDRIVLGQPHAWAAF
jgi:hypothetical protein